MPSCPKCKTGELEPTQPAPGLAARKCDQCQGLLLDLLSYRDWRERLPGAPTFADNQHALADVPAAHGGDAKKALLCPRCQRLMTKYRVSSEQDNRLDFCVHCADVWLDTGELSLLDTPSLAGDLGRIFTRPWQNSIREDRTAQMRQDHLAEHLGADLAKVQSFASWLADHPERDRILAYLLGDSLADSLGKT